MANICVTSLSIQKDEPIENAEAIRKAIEDTVTYDGDTVYSYEDEELLEIDVATRWNVPTDELKTIAKEFGVRIRAVGREDGCAFIQVVCVDEKGVVVQDESIGYAF